MTRWQRLVRGVKGPPLRSTDSRLQDLILQIGIPVLGLDALASAAYGPEAALTELLPLGAAGPRHMVGISVAIVILLAIVALSYRQTIAAYPDGGGCYIVASRNIGPWSGLLAGGALWIDYVLNAAVAVSAGVGALVSALPALQPHTLALCLLILALLTLINLRGVRDTGLALLVPTYLFVLCLAVVVAMGLVRWAHGAASPVTTPHALPAATTSASAWLVLRAFASGCSAMTGVEAVSNGVPLFREPTIPRAQRTLTTIVAILAALVLGIAWLSRSFHIGATPPGRPGYESVLSQLTRAAMGHGVFYYLTMAAVTAVLCLSANTSFADFPRLCRQLATDRFLPPRFAHQGSRLVFTAGILLLTGLAGALLVIWGGVTANLVPMFAIGALSAFTLSQAGMVGHWRAQRGHRYRMHGLILNALGAVATGVTAVVVLAAKFREGAWLTAVALGTLLLLFSRIKARTEAVTRDTSAADPMELGALPSPIVIVPIKRLDRLARRSMRFALTVSNDVTALQLTGVDVDEAEVGEAWTRTIEQPCQAAGRVPPRLIVLRSSFRRVVEPIIEHVRRTAALHPGRPLVVVVGELIERRWYHLLLRQHTATMLATRLLLEAGPGIVVALTPWYFRESSEACPRAPAPK